MIACEDAIVLGVTTFILANISYLLLPYLFSILSFLSFIILLVYIFTGTAQEHIVYLPILIPLIRTGFHNLCLEALDAAPQFILQHIAVPFIAGTIIVVIIDHAILSWCIPPLMWWFEAFGLPGAAEVIRNLYVSPAFSLVMLGARSMSRASISMFGMKGPVLNFVLEMAIGMWCRSLWGPRAVAEAPVRNPDS